MVKQNPYNVIYTTINQIETFPISPTLIALHFSSVSYVILWYTDVFDLLSVSYAHYFLFTFFSPLLLFFSSSSCFLQFVSVYFAGCIGLASVPRRRAQLKA